MNPRQAADGFALQLMTGLCVIWGLQQVMVKLAAADIAPIMQASGRSLIAAVLVALMMCVYGGWRGLRQGTLPGGLLVGLLFTSEFFFISRGLLYTSASHMSVFLYTAPIFSALALHFLLPSERLRLLQWLGILLCFAGIALCFGGTKEWASMNAGMLLGDAFGVLAGLSWGLTTVAVRATRLSEASPSLTLFYQLFCAAVLLPSAAWLLGDFHKVSLTALGIGSVLFQGVVVSFFSFFMWFWLLRRYLASHLAAFSFLTPMFGVAFGVLILGDPLTLNFLGGAALVLLGITLVSSEPWLRKMLRR